MNHQEMRKLINIVDKPSLIKELSKISENNNTYKDKNTDYNFSIFEYKLKNNVKIVTKLIEHNIKYYDAKSQLEENQIILLNSDLIDMYESYLNICEIDNILFTVKASQDWFNKIKEEFDFSLNESSNKIDYIYTAIIKENKVYSGYKKANSKLLPNEINLGYGKMCENLWNSIDTDLNENIISESVYWDKFKSGVKKVVDVTKNWVKNLPTVTGKFVKIVGDSLKPISIASLSVGAFLIINPALANDQNCYTASIRNQPAVVCNLNGINVATFIYDNNGRQKSHDQITRDLNNEYMQAINMRNSNNRASRNTSSRDVYNDIHRYNNKITRNLGRPSSDGDYSDRNIANTFASTIFDIIKGIPDNSSRRGNIDLRNTYQGTGGER